MKNVWKQIERTVRASSLDDKSKVNVIRALDEVIGGYLIEGTFPIDIGELSEKEFVIYRDILSVLNESNPPTVRNDKDYQFAVKELFKKIQRPNNSQQKIINDMDDAYQNGDWNLVNKNLKMVWP